MTKPRPSTRLTLNPQDFDAAIFDMDGVITQTATVHAAAWKRLFDEYLAKRLARGNPPSQPFDIADYRRYIDGKPRYEGVAAFLESRGIVIPWGDPNDLPGTETVCGLGNLKDNYFTAHLEGEGVLAYDGSVRLIRRLKESRVPVGIFSASRNAGPVLRGAGVIDLFDQRVDGLVAEELGISGKPEPDMLLELTRRLGSTPGRTVVFEDAIAGVQAGRSGGFRLVIGVNRGDRAGALVEQGAHVEISDLSEVDLTGDRPERPDSTA